MSNDDVKSEPTILGFLDSPEDYEKMVRKLVVEVAVLKDKDAKNERYRRPLRWLFSRVMAGIGTAIGAIVTMYVTGWHPFK